MFFCFFVFFVFLVQTKKTMREVYIYIFLKKIKNRAWEGLREAWEGLGRLGGRSGLKTIMSDLGGGLTIYIYICFTGPCKVF